MDSSDKIDQIKSWLGSGSINIFGMPFAGKDTQGKRLSDLLDAPLLGGGDILRGSNMPEEVKKLHKTGKLFPTDVYMKFVIPFISQARYKGKPLILSSVGRWHGEEAGVLEASSGGGHPIKAVIYLNIDEVTVWKRWQHSHMKKDRGEREDDAQEVLEIRIKEFQDKTIPVIDFYRSQDLIIEVSTDDEKDNVTENILDSLLRFKASN